MSTLETFDQVKEVSGSLAVAREQAKDLNFLAALALPEIVTFPFPIFYLYLWQRFTGVLSATRDFSKFGLGLPRGHGKTIFLKLLVLYVILFTKRRFVLVVCANAELAEQILADVTDMLSHPNIRKIFGNWDENVENDRARFKKFYFCGRDIILRGVGENSSFRGINVKMRRPDFIIFDDAQTRDCALSEVQAKAFIEKFTGTMLKTKAPDGCTFLYVGNMYKDLEIAETSTRTIYGCMLRNIQQSPEWESIIVGGILEGENGKEALWEDLQPLDQLMAEFRNDLDMGTPETFFAEVLNDPKGGVLAHFDFTQVPDYPYDKESEICEGKFIIIDPSLGKKKSDDMVCNLYYLMDGKPVLREIKIVQDTVPKMVEIVIQWAIQERIPLVLSEDYAFQASLIQWFVYFANKMKLEGIEFRGINRGHIPKNSAILGHFKELMRGDLYLHPSTKSTVFNQIAFFDATKTTNKDDIIDNCAYATIAVKKYSYEMLNPIENFATKSLPKVIDSRGVR